MNSNCIFGLVNIFNRDLAAWLPVGTRCTAQPVLEQSPRSAPMRLIEELKQQLDDGA